jgi:hypothetical protein
MQSLLSLEYLIIVPISKNFNHDDGKQGQISSNYANQFDVVIDATEWINIGNESFSPPLRMEKYITEIFPLSRVRDALECAAKKTTMKVQLIMGEEECQP